jgi:prephenate dehydrogenase
LKPTVAIIGVGLIGGSLGQALRRSGKYRVVGIGRHAPKLRDAKRRGAVDQFSVRLSDVSSADIVVLAGPVDTIVPVYQRVLPFLKPGTLVTDVSSVKGAILRAIARIPRPDSIEFVGGHPLAGSHRTGVKAAHSRLFKRSTVVLVPGSPKAITRLKSLWRAAGANVQIMSAPEHDRAVALISHLPHTLAHALVHSLAGRKDRRKILPLLAGSFRDMTRVAAADPEQWAQILRANAQPLREALRAFRRELDRIEHALPKSSLKPHLAKSQAFRRPLFHGI